MLPEDRLEELTRRRREAARRAVLVRRAVALAAAVLATGAIWFLLFRGSGSGEQGDRGQGGRGVSEPVAGLVREMTPAERVDQLLLLGFEGTDASAPMVANRRNGMYKTIAARRARKVFAALGTKDIDALLDGVADDVHHVFPGDHPLGGERHSSEAMRRWFERLYTLFPEIDFQVQRVAVRGWPWDMSVAVQWTDRGRAADGEPYENQGAHWIRLQRGKATLIRAYLDTEKVSEGCRRMAAGGIAEAAAPPIT